MANLGEFNSHLLNIVIGRRFGVLRLLTGTGPCLTYRKFLKMVCDVPEPEDRFNIDEYSEMVILNKPVIYISIGELINTHKVQLYITCF